MELNQRNRGRLRDVKLLAAVVGAAAIVALGALAVAFDEE